MGAQDRDPSTAPRVFYGAELRRLRETARLSQERLGSLVFCSGTYLGQIEAAVRKPRIDLARRLDTALGTGGHLERLCRMVNETQRYADYFEEAAELETLALTIGEYAPTLVPGLLQTAEYARAVIRGARPSATAEDVEAAVQARVDRSHLLRNDPTKPEFWVVLHETVLRLPVGGPEVMRRQLLHIAALAESGRILCQVLPFSAGADGVMAAAVSVMTFADAPTVAYTEAVHSGRLLDDPVVVAKCVKSYDLTRAVARSPEESLAFIRSIAEGYRDE